MKDKVSFLGRGWGFPPTFYKERELGVRLVSDHEDIKQSLEILLNTSIEERIMLSKYGCDLYTYLFDSISNSRIHLIKEMLRTAIIKYEPRIKLTKINLDESDYLDGIIRINLEYSVPLTNTRFNLVFPYYKVEGTDVPSLYRKQSQESKGLSKKIDTIINQ